MRSKKLFRTFFNKQQQISLLPTTYLKSTFARRGLEGFERTGILGPDHPDTLTAVNNFLLGKQLSFLRRALE